MSLYVSCREKKRPSSAGLVGDRHGVGIESNNVAILVGHGGRLNGNLLTGVDGLYEGSKVQYLVLCNVVRSRDAGEAHQ